MDFSNATVHRSRAGVARAVALSLVRALAVVVAMTVPAGASAQTQTSSWVSGAVRDEAGAALGDVRVVVEEMATGRARVLRTDRDGVFAARLLTPGTYALRAELLGFRPVVLAGVRLMPGRGTEVELRLERAEPPVMTIDTSWVDDASVGWSRAGASRWIGGLELGAPMGVRTEAAVASLALAADHFAVEGLPASLSRRSPEGFTFSAVDADFGSALDAHALTGVGEAELQSGVVDVEFGGTAGSQLVLHGRSGTRDLAVRSWGDGADPVLPMGFFSEDLSAQFDRARGGLEISGPLIRDTAVFLVGGQWRRTMDATPRGWRLDEAEPARIAAASRDSVGLPLLGFAVPRVVESEEFAGWGRFSWNVAPGQELTSFVDFSARRDVDEPAPLRGTADQAGESSDLFAGATLRSILSARFANEVRAAIVRTTRERPPAPGVDLRDAPGVRLPLTAVLAGDTRFGADAWDARSVDRTAFSLEQALLVTFGSHSLKAGFLSSWETREQSVAYLRAGAFTFGTAADFEGRAGRFVQTVGPAASASWSALEIGAFVQDTWRPAPGLEVVAGVRVTDERLPDDGVRQDGRWLELTGIDNTRVDDRLREFGPRLGFRWDVRDRNRWIVQAGFGVYNGDIDPALSAEWRTHDGAVRVRRGFGPLGSWPVLPDSTAAPVRGAALTLFGPGFRPPRSSRASLGVSRIGRTSIHASSVYRQTEFLPARRDVNRLPGAVYRDQHGRPVFGQLLQEGALVGAAPGSNRRFAEFDVVSAIESTASSEYWEVGLLVERRVASALQLAMAYTYSQTRDDWFARPGLLPFEAVAPQLADSGAVSDWVDGTSDLDVPHRLAVTGVLEAPLPLRPTLGLTYRYRSGLPYTPGFQPGVDVNADYASNDPAYVDGDLPGMDRLMERFGCLRDQVGEFAARNSCRADAVQALDLRLGVVVSTRAGTARLYVDAFNLLDSEIGAPDAALYRIDTEGELETDPVAGTVRVPLVVNDAFGVPQRPVRPGRVFRLGAEVTF